MTKLSQLPAPVLAGVVRESEKAAAIAEMRNCFYDGAGMIDLHLSCLEQQDEESLRAVIATSKLPVLALNYNNRADWSDCGQTEEERTALLMRAVDAGAAGVDMQGYTFDAASRHAFHGEDRYSFTVDQPKEVVTDESVIARQCDWIEQIHAKGAEVLLSCHPGVPMNARQVVDLALFLEQRKPYIIKIVTVAQNEDDLFESFRAMSMLKKEVRTPVNYHANGTAGVLSRIINPALGGHIAFCIDRYRAGSFLEQPDLRTARQAIDSLKKLM